MKKYRIFIISLCVFALSIGTVLAGDDIRVAADKYFKTYCTDAKPPITGQKAFLCEMRMRLDKNEQTIRDLQLATRTDVNVADANNRVLEVT